AGNGHRIGVGGLFPFAVLVCAHDGGVDSGGDFLSDPARNVRRRARAAGRCDDDLRILGAIPDDGRALGAPVFSRADAALVGVDEMEEKSRRWMGGADGIGGWLLSDHAAAGWDLFWNGRGGDDGVRISPAMARDFEVDADRGLGSGAVSGGRGNPKRGIGREVVSDGGGPLS